MARLFITPREIDFISDITKEIIKDVAGQKIYYFRIREDLSDIHGVYEESREKIFDAPVEIESLVEWSANEVKTNRFGSEEYLSVTAHIHVRDVNDRNINIREGDYFSYSSVYFEITSVIVEKLIFGQVEHISGYKVTGKQLRTGQINIRPIGPRAKDDADRDATQEVFVQQRGNKTNELGVTGDKRSLIDQGKLDATKPQKVEKDGVSSSFYGDEGD